MENNNIINVDGVIEELFGPPVRRSGQNSIHPCPQCGGAKHLWVHLERLCFRCFRCNWKGSVLGMTKITGTIPPAPPKVMASTFSYVYTELFNRLSLEERDRIILEKRQVDHDLWGIVTAKNIIKILDDFDIEVLIDSGLVLVNGAGKVVPAKAVENGRILIPYYNHGKVTYLRGYKQGDIPKYASPRVVSCDSIFGKIYRKATAVGVTEGEFKAAVAVQYGFSFLSIPGIWSCHKILVDYLLEHKIKSAYILFDTEDENSKAYEQVLNARTALTAAIEKEGIRVINSFLPKSEDLDKEDLDNFLINNGKRKLKKILGRV